MILQNRFSHQICKRRRCKKRSYDSCLYIIKENMHILKNIRIVYDKKQNYCGTHINDENYVYLDGKGIREAVEVNGDELSSIDPALAKDYVERTGVDALAISVGNAHGAYKLPPKLDFERIRTIAGEVKVPLVLHGGSGLTDDDFRKAIYDGISKVNIFTDINVAAAEAAAREFNSGKGKGLTDLILPAVDAIKQECEKKMTLFSSCGHGNIL